MPLWKICWYAPNAYYTHKVCKIIYNFQLNRFFDKKKKKMSFLRLTMSIVLRLKRSTNDKDLFFRILLYIKPKTSCRVGFANTFRFDKRLKFKIFVKKKKKPFEKSYKNMEISIEVEIKGTKHEILTKISIRISSVSGQKRG